MAVADFLRQQEAQNELLEDKDLAQELRDISGEPILVIYKHLDHDDRVTPTIQMYANPLDATRTDTLAEARLAEAALDSYYMDYVLETKPQLVPLGGLLGVAWRYRYTFGDSRRTPLRAWVSIVRSSKAEFSIGMVCPAEGPDKSESEFRSVRDSIDLQWEESPS